MNNRASKQHAITKYLFRVRTDYIRIDSETGINIVTVFCPYYVAPGESESKPKRSEICGRS